ncbi:MAG: hypothetical protein PVG53_00920 [Holophagae bacterium]|jgi:hypothetical protein
MQRITSTVLLPAVLLLLPASASAQLSLQWMVPAAAHTAGLNGTFWATDLSLHNPHDVDLPVVVQFLPSDTDNQTADTMYVTLYPYETYNLWDVLGDTVFAVDGTGALLVFADWDLDCEPVESCHFLVTSRTYTRNPSGPGEYGQTIPGAAAWRGVDWDTLGYAAGLLNDGVAFRTNLGLASWSGSWTTVAVDVQDAAGTILERLVYDVPPFGHIQRRLPTTVEGGSVVFWIQDGGSDALIYGYVSVVDESTGDASFQLARPSTVGWTAAQSAIESSPRRPVPATDGPVRSLVDRPTGRDVR